jgi:hypothetical protein
VRALAEANANEVDAAFGRAARPILQARSTHALVVLLGLMGERSLASAQERLAKNEAPAPTAAPDDVAFGRAIGAWAAMQLIATHGEAFNEHERAALLGQLRVLAPDPLIAPVAALIAAAA